jgi:oxygen-dependent protoporphyrinogen oxidase
MTRRVIVVGGGISGLAVAHGLMERGKERGIDVLCLEASDRPGGNIRTTRERGFLCEWGATGFLDSAPATLTLARMAGLEERLVRARDEAARRFVYRAGRLHQVPLGGLSLLASGILPPLDLLRLFLEPLIPRRRAEEPESVHAFAARRIGRGAADLLVDPLVSGVFAGDARQLELETTFPVMREMESRHGSLFRAWLARRRSPSAGGPAGPGGRLASFTDGLEELIVALARALGPRLELGRLVTALSGRGTHGFRVHLREGAPHDADCVVLACPAEQVASIVRALDAELAAALDEIPRASLAVVHLGYRRQALGPQPDGLGFLVPRGQGPRILGALWPASIFPGRAPPEGLLVSAMIGGAHDPGAVNLDDLRLLAAVKADLRTVLDIRADPYFVKVVRHPRGIPQYTLGHRARQRVVDRRLAALPGLWVTGNSVRGISINACVGEADRVAGQVLESLAARVASV